MLSKRLQVTLFVPQVDNDGKPFSSATMQIVDNKIMSLADGMTVHPLANGFWRSPKRGYQVEPTNIYIVVMEENIQSKADLDYAINYLEEILGQDLIFTYGTTVNLYSEE